MTMESGQPMKQKDVFLSGEGDAWHKRNLAVNAERVWSKDIAFSMLAEAAADFSPQTTVLEVGCGMGGRLAELKQRFGCQVFGIDPSLRAVEHARSLGVSAEQGTADKLPFDDGRFDVVILGFCLYLCDRDDLFTIAAEVHRVLKTSGWVLILDFYSKDVRENDYRHFAGIKSFKMDCARLFDWHPWYTRFSQRVVHHVDGRLTDSVDDWVAVTLIRKHGIPC
jgi:ubiquinone/menaquinone biosynthesis C-methylase UbiE